MSVVRQLRERVAPVPMWNSKDAAIEDKDAMCVSIERKNGIYIYKGGVREPVQACGVYGTLVFCVHTTTVFSHIRIVDVHRHIQLSSHCTLRLLQCMTERTNVVYSSKAKLQGKIEQNKTSRLTRSTRLF
ncbi:hypothetical protein TRVL_04040 [Trypanosoma vivax]|nr:hypothetical protein TRVL_04040 [Trypanosoma vivax]